MAYVNKAQNPVTSPLAKLRQQIQAVRNPGRTRHIDAVHVNQHHPRGTAGHHVMPVHHGKTEL